MTELVIIVIVTAWASQYDPGVMEKVVANQQKWGRLPVAVLPDVDGFVAVSDCSRIGDVLYLRPTGQVNWEKYLIVDCAGSEATRDWMKVGNIVAEVDAQTAIRWGTVRMGARVEVGKRIRRFVAR